MTTPGERRRGHEGGKLRDEERNWGKERRNAGGNAGEQVCLGCERMRKCFTI